MAAAEGAMSSTAISRSAVTARRRRRCDAAGETIWARTVSLTLGCSLEECSEAARSRTASLHCASETESYLQTPASLQAACNAACVFATSPLVTNSAMTSLYFVAQLSNAAAP